MLMCGRNQHNIVKQVSSNKKIKKKKWSQLEVLKTFLEGWPNHDEGKEMLQVWAEL